MENRDHHGIKGRVADSNVSCAYRFSDTRHISQFFTLDLPTSNKSITHCIALPLMLKDFRKYSQRTKKNLSGTGQSGLTGSFNESELFQAATKTL